MVLPTYLYYLPFLFSLSAFALAWFGTTCHFLQFQSTTPISNPIYGQENEKITIQFGYWYYQSWTPIENNKYNDSDYNWNTGPDLEGCDMYPSSISADNFWLAARGLNLTVIILGGAIMMLDVFQGCRSARRTVTMQTGAVGYLVCCVASAFSLLMLNSSLCKDNSLIGELNSQLATASAAGGEGGLVQFEETCSISTGGKSTIAATVLWFVAAVVMAALHPFHKKTERGVSEGLDEPLFGANSSTII